MSGSAVVMIVFMFSLALCNGAPLWHNIGTNQECDGSTETFRGQSSANVDDIDACKKSCEDEAECKSITFFPNNKFCSHFSSPCTRVQPTEGFPAIAMQKGIKVDWKKKMPPAERARTVPVGTNVVIKWPEGGHHNVYIVEDKKAFDECDWKRGDKKASNAENPFTYTASAAGTVYFICQVGNGQHCKADQNLALTVTGDANSGNQCEDGFTKSGSGCTAADCDIANSDRAAGTSCRCNTGFTGTITWSGATPSGTCTSTQCTGSNANAPANGAVSKSAGDNHGSKATFTCNNGFRVNGANSITCAAESADAAWPSPPTCVSSGNQCDCPNGTPKTGDECTTNGAKMCEKCDRWYSVVPINENQKTSKCKAMCQCPDGSAKTGPSECADDAATCNIKWERGMDTVRMEVQTGDRVVFKWDLNHNVVKVINEIAWNGCLIRSNKDPDSNHEKFPDDLGEKSPFTFNAKTVDVFYLACRKNLGDHCRSGTKAKITVVQNPNWPFENSNKYLFDQACDPAKDGILKSASGKQDSLLGCARACSKNAECKTVTFFSDSKLCNQFSTICKLANLIADTKATTVRFQLDDKPDTVTVSDNACDVVKSGYLQSPSGFFDSLAACSKSCQSNDQCKSITYYSSKDKCAGWCHQFSSACDDYVKHAGALIVRFKSAPAPAPKLPPNAVVLSDKGCDSAKSGYLNSSPGKLDGVAECAQSCQKSSQCKSVTFYASYWCSHFSTTCDNLVDVSGATSVRLQKQQLTTPAPKLPPNAVVLSGKACDAAKSGHLSSSPGLVDNLAACAQPCQKSSQCNTVTFYSSGWCSHFSSTCDNLLDDNGATSVRLQKQQMTTSALPSNAAKMEGKSCDDGSAYLSSGPGKVDNLSACNQSCQKSSPCKSVTFYKQSTWCSHFSTICTKFNSDDGATTVTFT